MKKIDIGILPQFFERYINPVENIELIEGLEKGLTLFDSEIEKLKFIADKRYAPNKWTVKEVIQHITDNERIQSYRALRIARNDKTNLPGYDEELLGNNTNTGNISIEDLIHEFKLVRQSSVFLFKHLSDEMLLRKSICSNIEISALALGFVLIGHQEHHLNVIKERYY
jgi:hypothetical protein